jgi:hypothetical protein
MDHREIEPQKCKGRFGILTHTRAEEREFSNGLKDGVQCFIHNQKVP